MSHISKIITALVLITLVTPFSKAQEKPQKPNIVFFLADDLGWTDVEPFGTTFYETPHIKELALQGMRFTNAYATCPVCSPTRVSIMTGKYPVGSRTTDWFGAPQPEEILNSPAKKSLHPLLPASYSEHMALSEVTIAEALKAGGYKTFFAGKWHMGETEDYWPERQGFDINIGGYSAGSPKSYFSPYRNPKLTDGPEGEHLPDRLANETNKFMAENKDQPFFVYLSFYSVHNPLQGRKDLVEKYQAKRARLGLTDEFSSEGKNKVRTVQSHVTYASVVEGMDLAVGKVIQQLKDEGIYDNTIIVFFSDNGGLATAEGLPTSNLPLRGGKGWLYEGGIREPLIIKWPGLTRAGSVCNEPVISNDFYPTLLQAAGLPLLPKQHTGGVSMKPLLEGKSTGKRDFYWHYPHYSNQGGGPGAAIREGDWKLIRWYETGKEELFNLKNDLSEKNNLISSHAKIARNLSSKLDVWLKKEKAVFPQKNPGYMP